MASSKLDICNRVIQKIGGKKLTNLTGTDIYTTAVNRAYDSCLEYELRTHNWNFALRRAQISRQQITVSSITSANPGVVTYTGNDPLEDETVYISGMTEMTEVNGSTYRIKNLNVSAKTFQLYDVDAGTGVDTSGYTAESTGGAVDIGPVYGWRYKYKLPNADLTITAVTQANPGVVTFTGTTPRNGDRIYIQNVGGMTELNGNYYVIGSLNPAAGTFALLDENDGSNINTSGYTAYTSGGTAKSNSIIRVVAINGYVGLSNNLGSLGKSQDYNIEDGYIYTNDSDPLQIRYVYNEREVLKWDTMFKEAIVALLAKEIAVEIEQDDGDVQGLTREYIGVIQQAKLADSIETPSEALPECDWLEARL